MAGKSKSKVKPQKPSAAPAWTRRFQQPPKRPRLPKMPNLLWLLKWTVLLLALFLRSYKPDLDLELDALLPVSPNGENSVKTALVVTAHPDDEAMFFAPTILALVRHGWQVGGLCLSTGAFFTLPYLLCTSVSALYAYLHRRPSRPRRC
jgi:hypothetical protein